MLLQILNDYARNEGLVESIELTSRTIHLALVLGADGSVDTRHAWQPLATEVRGKKGETKTQLGQSLTMPRFPGENNGGKAHFLADGCVAVLGIDPKTGKPLPEDPKVGKNPTKAFQHFWQRVEEAHEATGLAELATLLAFRDRYLSDPAVRGALPFLAVVPIGKKPTSTLCAAIEGEPIPLEGRTITFSVGGHPIFRPDSPLHDYWKGAYRREAFSGESDGAGGGLCIVTGLDDQPIAESHKPEIKGVPGLPPKGGYLVSFAREAPALASYGFEGTRNAPVSEQAVAGYALALNDLLRRDKPYARTVNQEFVICAWIRDDPDLSHQVNGITQEPTDDALARFFEAVEAKGVLPSSLHPLHYHSLTLASNGGRVVVRRWLDVPLPQVVANLNAWFEELRLDTIASKSPSPPYRALDVLAHTTARTPSDVRAETYDALYRAALEGSNPMGLLPQVLHRLRIAAIQKGANLRYEAARFALIKLILIRSEDLPMPILPQLCETQDPPYNCGRLLAVLDDLQYKAQGNVGADILARYYGNASTFPRNVFPRLLRLARAHLNKLSKEDPGAERAIQGRLNEICALFRPSSDGGSAEFPGQLDIREQGRFALGFYQQKAQDQRDREAFLASKSAEKNDQKAASQTSE